MDPNNYIEWTEDENGVIKNFDAKLQCGIPNPDGEFTQFEYIDKISFPSTAAFKRLAQEGKLTEDNNTFTSTAVEYINSLLDAQQRFYDSTNFSPKKNVSPKSATAVNDVAAEKLLRAFVDEISGALDYLGNINANHLTALQDSFAQRQKPLTNEDLTVPEE